MISSDNPFNAMPRTCVDDGLDALRTKITEERGVPCVGYKPSCLRRRVSVRVRATGAGDFVGYAALLDREPAEWLRLLDALTVNVTGFFRDDTVYARLRADVIPSLARAHTGLLHAWSAGCSSGEEAWTVAMLLADAVGLDRTSVLATDIDVASLARARAAVYPEVLTRDIPDVLRHAWWQGTESLRAVDALRARVAFRAHNLFSDSPPCTGLHLITCRNVIIYFSRPAQEQLFTRFADALVPGGVLVLGKVEMLSGPARARFEAIDVRERIYRRVA